ncbi:MAG: ELWxxDGT repeat protein [Cyanobacteria bacterium J06582_2]
MDTNLGQVVLVKDINPIVSNAENGSSSTYDSFPQNLTEFDNKLFFSADNGESGTELFVSDGTVEGTQLVVDLNPGVDPFGYFIYSSSPSDFAEFNDKLYFAADNGEDGRELFVSDGTAEGTQLLVDLNPGSSDYGFAYSSSPSGLTELNGKLYFAADNGESGTELFVSDGTAEGTQLLVDLNPGSSDYGFAYSSDPAYIAEVNGKLFFAADNGESGTELFVSDGTAEGTQLLVDLNPGSNNYGSAYSSFPSGFTEFNDKLYFTARGEDGGFNLYVSDGTASGTQVIFDLNPGSNRYRVPNSYYSELIVFDDQLYFVAEDNESGRELFVSDGTAEGTQLLVGLNPGGNDYVSYSSAPGDFAVFDDQLYFAADDGENGRELFVSDGTAEGTQLVADLNPGEDNYGTRGSYPRYLTVAGNELFFNADNGETGAELFKLTIEDLTPEAPILIDGTNGSDNLLGGDRSEQIQALSGQDTVDSGGGNDTVDGGNGDDRLSSFSGNNSLIGNNGNDTLDSGDGADLLDGGNGSDVLSSGSGNDSLTGGGNNDTLDAGDGIDTLFGDNGDDRLVGGSGDDFLTGGSGNDFLDGGIGFDNLEGGNGDDLFVLRSGDGTDTITDFNVNGGDRLGLADGLQFESLTFSGNDILSGGEVLASLDGVNTEQLTAVQFREI